MKFQVIQPTPEMSPSASENNLVENSTASGLQVPGMYDQMHRLSVTSFDLGNKLHNHFFSALKFFLE